MSNIDKIPEATMVYDIECDDCGAIMEIHVFNEQEDGVGEPIYCPFCGSELPENIDDEINNDDDEDEYGDYDSEDGM